MTGASTHRSPSAIVNTCQLVREVFDRSVGAFLSDQNLVAGPRTFPPAPAGARSCLGLAVAKGIACTRSRCCRDVRGVSTAEPGF